MKKRVKITLGVIISVLIICVFFVPSKPDVLSIVNESEDILNVQMEIIGGCVNEHSISITDETVFNDSVVILQEQAKSIKNDRDKFNEDSLEYKVLNELYEIYICKIGGTEIFKNMQGGSLMDIMMYGAMIDSSNEELAQHEENYEKYMGELGFTRGE